MRELNSYDKRVIADIKSQFEEVRDPSGKIVKEAYKAATAQYGTVSLAAEEALVKEGYNVENKMPFCIVTQPE